jgi:hypothetical protein
MFTNHGKDDGIYPLKEIAKHKTKIKRSCTNTYKGLAFSTH